MNIQYYGHSCFKITTKSEGKSADGVVAFIDPFDKKIGLKPPQGKADVVFVSHKQHDDHNNVDALKDSPVVIDAPGEYSVKGINVAGIDSFHDDKEGAQRGRNTIFVLDTEDIRVCHLGDLGTDLSVKQLEKIGNVDVLMIPVGGNYTIDFKEATKIAKKLSPAIIIPMHYKMKGTNADISDEKDFCNEVGNCPKEKVNKINLKKKDLEGKNMEILLMSI
ncbi:MAG: Zn-dependent hydrolase of the beta-lactamase fold-like protein [uncultured bacterium]|nr:MAG: Zn-dependent hydrolase of the beta-lactamase fold-like protein [uncultured bacterium]KKP69124.1 MAG: Zn-dependent hydrolase of the beta-lactamase fold-like protein [Candidatus Moranbacteria bacterium GW2011_GWE1_35_17]KKP70828.1 MAG: Zn-dependent hydrolase of the beta-lactamase fold-like protein [Candidatus Moranbacteria bacterium GW2011_GWE2_35_164]KKP83560.1 MAG: Zn-dependent hydrolase of the beta-lactamase fold-like protein [Candidatus Moranbacteria bacterium GW2011_GWF1_35_5]KKP8447